MRPNLVYILAIDPPGYGGNRQLAKMLASSLVRTYFTGDILLFRNTPQPLFLMPRKGVEEVFIDCGGSLATADLRELNRIGRPWLPPVASTIQRASIDATQIPLNAATGSRPLWTRARAEALARVAMSLKYGVRSYVDPSEYGWVVYMDADCLSLRNLDHLFPCFQRAIHSPLEAVPDEASRLHAKQTFPRSLSPPAPGLHEDSDADILYQPEVSRTAAEEVFSAYLSDTDKLHITHTSRIAGINSGTWAVRGQYYHELMQLWQAIEETPPNGKTQWTEQGAWNRIILGCNSAIHSELSTLTAAAPRLHNISRLRARPFAAGEICFPLLHDKAWQQYKRAALLHAVGVNIHEKFEFLFGMYMQRFYGDSRATLLNILDL